MFSWRRSTVAGGRRRWLIPTKKGIEGSVSLTTKAAKATIDATTDFVDDVVETTQDLVEDSVTLTKTPISWGPAPTPPRGS